MLRRSSAVAVVATVVGGWLGQAPALADQPSGHTPGTGTATADTDQSRTVPAVWPRPQSLAARGRFARVTPAVTLVAGQDADPYALDVVEDALRAAGATDVVRTQGPGPASVSGTGTGAHAGLTVYAGAAAQGPLDRLRAPAPGDLPAGGYRLAVDGTTVALDGIGDDGLFHAAQTLRQLATTRHGERGFPGVTVRDWPAAPVRGITEAFYGVPWTQEQRLAQLDFLARTKQNRFLYAPGDDPYRQAQWREPYPQGQRADFRVLAERAARDHVTLAWAVAPGQAMCFSSAADQRALERKLDAMWALGVRAFQLQFQDVSYSEWHCGADAARFGSGPDAAARAQAGVANATADHLVRRYGAGTELSLLPTEFYQDGPTPYRTALAQALDPRVDVAWTGVGVLPRTITGDQVAGAKAALRHPLMTVDNYPVNDFAPDRLFLGPYTGREPAVAAVSAGVLASAMQQPAASRVPLFTAADYAWNPRAYDPAASWRAAIDDLAGPDPRARAALRALADNESASALGGQESAYLRPLTTAFWAALDARDTRRLEAAARELRGAFAVMAGAPAGLNGLAGGTFGDEVRPWLDRLSLYGSAGGHAVDALVAQARGDGAAAWQARRALDRDRGALGLGSTAKVGGATLDAFLSRAVDASDAWTGVGTDGRTATTSMASGHGTDPAAMVDGKDSTAWSTDAPPQPDDSFGVDLGMSRPVGAVRVAMGDGSGSDDFLHDAVLETADDDGSGWHRVGEYHDQAVVQAELPPGTRARRVRLRAAGTQESAVMVREFAVSVPGQSPPEATGPQDAPAVVDGDLATSAGPGPVTVRFAGARLLDTVTVAAAPEAARAGAGTVPPGPPDAPRPPAAYGPPVRERPTRPDPVTVEVRTAGVWRAIGTLDPGGWTELHAGVLADAVRLSDADGVHEIVPWFADAPRVSLDRSAELDAQAGATAVVTARVASGLPRTLSAAVAVGAAPHGVTVTAPAAVPLPRGVTAAVPLTVRVAAGTAPGTYTVPVRFTVAGRTVERRLTLRTHPATGGPDLVPGAKATSSADETPAFPASAVADGDPATRWSSPVEDDAWVQVELPAPARVGRVVLHWQDAYAARYEIQTSPDGVTWHTAAAVADGDGGTETVWPDARAATRFLRVQGICHATAYGYSLYGIEAYAVTG